MMYHSGNRSENTPEGQFDVWNNLQYNIKPVVSCNCKDEFSTT
jgi:hypothetical protein